MIKYYKLFQLLNQKNMKKTDLRQILNPATIAKLSKGENLTTNTIDKICEFLDCQPGDIMEYINTNTLQKELDESTNLFGIMIQDIINNGTNKENLKNMIKELLSINIDKIFENENVNINQIIETAVALNKSTTNEEKPE